MIEHAPRVRGARRAPSEATAHVAAVSDEKTAGSPDVVLHAISGCSQSCTGALVHVIFCTTRPRLNSTETPPIAVASIVNPSVPVSCAKIDIAPGSPEKNWCQQPTMFAVVSAGKNCWPAGVKVGEHTDVARVMYAVVVPDQIFTLGASVAKYP